MDFPSLNSITVYFVNRFKFLLTVSKIGKVEGNFVKLNLNWIRFWAFTDINRPSF